MSPHMAHVWYVASVSALIGGPATFVVIEAFDRTRERLRAGLTKDSPAAVPAGVSVAGAGVVSTDRGLAGQMSQPTGPGEQKGIRDANHTRIHPGEDRRAPQGADGSGIQGRAGVSDRAGSDPARRQSTSAVRVAKVGAGVAVADRGDAGQTSAGAA